jgi:hypothetical protein
VTNVTIYGEDEAGFGLKPVVAPLNAARKSPHALRGAARRSPLDPVFLSASTPEPKRPVR